MMAAAAFPSTASCFDDDLMDNIDDEDRHWHVARTPKPKSVFNQVGLTPKFRSSQSGPEYAPVHGSSSLSVATGNQENKARS